VKHVPEWFPGARFKTQAREWRKSVDAMVDAPFAFVKRSLVRLSLLNTLFFLFLKRVRQADGTAVSSIATRWLEDTHELSGTQEREEMISQVAGTMYTGMLLFAPFYSTMPLT
jgi:hypothetical protein